MPASTAGALGEKGRRFIEPQTQIVTDRPDHQADEEWQAPPPGREIVGAKRARDQRAGEAREKDRHALARELPGAVKSAPRRRRRLDQESGGARELASRGKSLQQPAHND